MAVAGPPGGFGEEGRSEAPVVDPTAGDPVPGVPAPDDGGGEDYIL
jgi:hypothetical protein